MLLAARNDDRAIVSRERGPAGALGSRKGSGREDGYVSVFRDADGVQHALGRCAG